MELFKYLVNRYTLLITLMLLSAYPYVLSSLLGLPSEITMNLIFTVIMVLAFMSMRGKSFLPSIIIISFVIQVCVWFMFSIIHNDSSYYTRFFFLFMTMIAILVLTKSRSLYKFGFLYNNIILVQSVLGAIAFILIYSGLLEPLLLFERGERIMAFYGLTCTNAFYGNFIRVGGFFDEPGALASWGLFALVINKLIFDNRRIELVLSISLLFTFSAAYFVMIPLYYLFFYYKRIKYFVMSLLIIIPTIVVGFYYLRDSEMFMDLTMERFKDGEIRSKRTIYAEQSERIFKKNAIFGVGGRELEKYYEGTNDNQYEILAKDGIVGYFATYLPLFLLCGYFYKNKNILLGSILLFICYQQRPFHINEMHNFMLYFYMTIIYYRFNKVAIEKEELKTIQSFNTKIVKKNEDSRIINLS